MSDFKNSVGVFILAKNEEPNINRSLAALSSAGWPVHVLDSGSTDATREIVSQYSFATLTSYQYRTHCEAYNEITTELGKEYRFVIVLDSDMLLSSSLQKEIKDFTNNYDGSWLAVRADIEMCVDGKPLTHGSLYPPKPFLFITGQALFVSVGHAERLKDGVSEKSVRALLRHDDRKGYDVYLQSQYRYSSSLIDRYVQGNVSSRDRIRVKWPLLILVVPIYSIIVRRGLLSGRAGIVYALDRLIAEAIMYRQAVAYRMRKDSK